MGSSFEVPLSPDDRARLNDAADVLGVPPDRREDFVEGIGTLVATVRIKNKFSSELIDARSIAAAKAVRSACTAVVKLSPTQKAYLGVILVRPFITSRLGQKRKEGSLTLKPYHVIREECDKLNLQLGCDTFPWLDPTMGPDTEDDLAELMIKHLDAALGESIDRSPHAATGERKRPRGSKAQWAMRTFVVELWKGSRFFGEVTLSEEGGQAGGTIVDILYKLKPMLPNRFFPRILSHAFLRDVQKSLPPDPLRGESKALKRRVWGYSE